VARRQPPLPLLAQSWPPPPPSRSGPPLPPPRSGPARAGHHHLDSPGAGPLHHRFASTRVSLLHHRLARISSGAAARSAFVVWSVRCLQIGGGGVNGWESSPPISKFALAPPIRGKKHLRRSSYGGTAGDALTPYKKADRSCQVCVDRHAGGAKLRTLRQCAWKRGDRVSARVRPHQKGNHTTSPRRKLSNLEPAASTGHAGG
jgi:hypothetical protein